MGLHFLNHHITAYQTKYEMNESQVIVRNIWGNSQNIGVKMITSAFETQKSRVFVIVDH